MHDTMFIFNIPQKRKASFITQSIHNKASNLPEINNLLLPINDRPHSQKTVDHALSCFFIPLQQRNYRAFIRPYIQNPAPTIIAKMIRLTRIVPINFITNTIIKIITINAIIPTIIEPIVPKAAKTFHIELLVMVLRRFI